MVAAGSDTDEFATKIKQSTSFRLPQVQVCGLLLRRGLILMLVLLPVQAADGCGREDVDVSL